MNVVAYCRYSSEAQRDGYSIEAQIKAITSFCTNQGYTLINTYIDEAKSGTNDTREAFQTMISDSSKHSFEAVVVHKLDRFARNRYDSAIYKKKLKDNGVSVFSVLERLDDSPESVIMEGLLEAMSEYYSKNLAREVLKGRNESAAKGNHAGGICPYGYKDVNRKYVIVPEEAVVVKKIFKDYSQGASYTSLARELDSLGYRTRNGLIFEPAGIRNILKNPIYTGTLVYNKVSTHGASPSTIENACEAIIDMDTYNIVQDRLSKPRTRAIPKKKSERNYLLTGILKCAVCGGNIVGHTSNRMYTKNDGTKARTDAYYYKCTNSKSTLRKPATCSNNKMIRKEHIEEYCYSLIMDLLFKPETIDIIAGELKDKINNASNQSIELSKLKKENQKIQSKIDRLLDIYLDGKIDKESYAIKSKELTAERAIIEEKISKLSIIIAPQFDTDKLKKALKHVIDKNDNTPEFKAKIIKLFLDRVEINTDYLEFFFKLPIGPNGEYSCLKEKQAYYLTLYTRINITSFISALIPSQISLYSAF